MAIQEDKKLYDVYIPSILTSKVILSITEVGKNLKQNLEKVGYVVKYIDIQVGDDYEKLINNINTCKYIISSSLHGVIMGIIYKRKTIYIQFSNKVIGGDFKFNDFFKSINIQ